MAPAAGDKAKAAASTSKWSVFKPSTVSAMSALRCGCAACSADGREALMPKCFLAHAQWGQGKKVKIAHLPEGESNMYYHPEVSCSLACLLA